MYLCNVKLKQQVKMEQTTNKKVFIVDWDTCEYQSISVIIVAEDKEEAKNIVCKNYNAPFSDVNVMEISTDGESRVISFFYD